MKLRYKILNGLVGFFVLSIVVLTLVLSHSSPCEPLEGDAVKGQTMQAIVGRCYGSADILELETLPRPMVSKNEVLVKIKAAAVNPLDWHYMRGSPYLMRLVSGIGKPKDVSVGVDFSGVVEAVGDEVTRFSPGDEVFGGASGAFAEYIVVTDERAVVHKPDSVSFVQAAALPIAAITALQAVRDKAGVKPGDRVLVNGASGGVGTYAVQIAKAYGAQVTGVCSTRNVELVQSLGADRVIDYKKASYAEDEAVYDVIIDMVGNHSMTANKNVLVPGGKLVMVGGPKGNWIAPLINPLKAMFMKPFVDREFTTLLATMNQPDLTTLGELMEQGKLVSVIDRSFALRQVPAAIRYSESGRARGKIIIDMQ
ncbi:MAG: NAD(P)-dependent alcohol dehydrogenase [Pseudomonadota bacterium]